MGFGLQDNAAPFVNVVANAIASIAVETDGFIYDSWILDWKEGAGAPVAVTAAVMEVSMTNVEFDFGGTIQRQLSFVELYKIERYHNYTIDDGLSVIRFARPDRPSIDEANRTLLGTGDLNDINVRVTIAAGIVNPTLKLIPVRLDATDAVQTGVVNTMARKSIELSAVGVKQFAVEPTLYDVRDPKTGRTFTLAHEINHMYVFSSELTDILIKRGDKVLLKCTVEQLQRKQRDAGYAPQAGMVDISPTTMTGFLKDNLNHFDPRTRTNRSLTFELTYSGTANHDILIDRVGARKK